MILTTLSAVGVIGLASLYKTSVLSAGGGVVARSLGGVRVSPDTTDPRQRRLLNVVEEMAIASGVPMPEVYLLEQESGINAFAAGHNPANAAVAVTRGALTSLNRSELQGVIAHEFSHVLNGDMRLNVRLMGLLFGLLVIAIIARTVLRFAPGGRSGKKGGGVAVIMLAALRDSRHWLHRTLFRSPDSGRGVAQSGVAGGRIRRPVHARSVGAQRRVAEDRRCERGFTHRESGRRGGRAHAVRARNAANVCDASCACDATESD